MNRSKVRTEALAMQFDRVAMEGGFDLVIVTGEPGETIATGTVMDAKGAEALSAFAGSTLKLMPQLHNLLPKEYMSEIHIGHAGGFKIHMKFFEFGGQRLVVAARAFKPTCDPALLDRLCTGTRRILAGHDLLRH